MAAPVKYTPPPSPPSPTASYYDLSDDDEDEYNTIAHARSGKGVKLLYSKSKVQSPTLLLLPQLIPRLGLCTSYTIRQR